MLGADPPTVPLLLGVVDFEGVREPLSVLLAVTVTLAVTLLVTESDAVGVSLLD